MDAAADTPGDRGEGAEAGARSRSPDRALMALVAGLALLAVACAGAVWFTDQQQQSAAWARHSLEVENRISNVLSLLQDAETGERGYLLSGRPGLRPGGG